MKQYHDGPIPYQKRKCTDCCCLIIFLVLGFSLLGIAIYAWSGPNFSKLAVPYDPDGKGCGVAYPSYPYIYFASPHANSLWVTVCVSKCPVSTDPVLACHPNSVVTSCAPKKGAVNSQTVQIYNTTLIGKICLPTSSALQHTIAPATSGFATRFAALAIGWKLILLAIPVAIVLSLITMVLIRCFATCFIYILIFILVGVLIAFGIYVWTQPVGGFIGSSSLFKNNVLRAVVSILSFLLAFAIVLFVCCYRSRISLASKITEVAAIFVAKKCLIVLVPFLMFGVTLFLVAVWVLVALGFYSLGTPVHCTHCYPFQHFNLSNWIYALLVVHVFYLLWSTFLFVSVSQFVIGGTACGWYFKQESPYYDTSRRLVGKHLGSVCAGSFLLALIGFIKLIYTLLAPDPAKEHTGCLSYISKCCNCLCWLCIGKLFDWLNTGAYTWVNMAGDPYCSSALEALALRMKNAAASGVLYVLSIIYAVLIRGGIIALTVFITYLMIQNISYYKTSIQDSSLLLVVVGLLAFAVSSFFMGVYSDSMESIYMTYLMDVDAGMDGGNCPDALKQFIDQAQRDAHMIPAKEV